MTSTHGYSRVLAAAAVAAAGFLGAAPATADPGCRTGGVAAANAYVLFNPIYALYFGRFEDYVAQNSEHFRADGNAVRCLAALSRAFLGAGIQMYDPADLQRKQQIDAELGTMGISPGPQQPTASSALFGMGMQLSWLARGLPAAADGNYVPFNTPANEIERMQLMARVMLQQLLQDPTVRQTFAAMEPLIREAARLEYKMITDASARLANAQ